MAVRTKQEIIKAINDKFGEDTSDEFIALMEDVSDTLDAAEKTGQEDWKSKYEENDKMWREKYKARFMSGEPEDSLNDKDNVEAALADDGEEKVVIKTYEELFETKKEE